jgi:hypothetical protein
MSKIKIRAIRLMHWLYSVAPSIICVNDGKEQFASDVSHWTIKQYLPFPWKSQHA